jgi:hypothetical protein
LAHLQGVANIGYNLSMLPPTSPQSKPLLERLQAINQQFYANFAEQFAQTRHLLNPGIEQAFATLAAEQAASFIDVGCGDGRVGRHWLRLSQASRVHTSGWMAARHCWRQGQRTFHQAPRLPNGSCVSWI